MPLTRAFKFGDSQAILIPEELAYDDVSMELNISRHGDVIVISPVRPSAQQMVAELRAMRKWTLSRFTSQSSCRIASDLDFGLSRRHEYRDPGVHD